MEQAYTVVFKFLAYLVPIGITLGVAFTKFLAPKIVDGLVDLKFCKELEKYRHDLDAQKKTLEHDLQKQILQYQTSIEKKSIIYQTLFEKIMIADGAIDESRIYGIKISCSYEKWGFDTFKKVMETYYATSLQIDEVIAKLKNDRQSGEESFIKEMDFLKGINGKNKLRDAKNYFWTQKIYLSVSINQIAQELFASLLAKTLDHEYPDGVNPKEYNEREKTLRDIIIKFENQMRTEMGGEQERCA